MKFGELLKKRRNEEWKYFYVHYDELKRIIKEGDDDKFHQFIEHELCKVNSFFNLIQKYDPMNEHLTDFILINYMALFKSIKKFDKNLCKLFKLKFFALMQAQPFYQHYWTLSRKCKQIKLVIFDKDGTLIDILSAFGPWAKQLVANMSDILPPPNTGKQTIWQKLGYDPKSNQFSFDSVFAKGTNDDIRNCIGDYILENTAHSDHRTSIVAKSTKEQVLERWIETKPTKENLKTFGNLDDIFSFLRDRGVKIAICTSDDRQATETTIEILGIGKYLEAVMCGDDEVSSKPSPEPIWEICGKLEVDPSETVMVGDTISDLHAGLNAKCGKVISVLTGGYHDTELNGADHVLPSIEHVCSIIEQNHDQFADTDECKE